MSTREQLDIYVALSEYLGSELGAENPFVQQLQRRRESLDAIAQVAEHLALPDNQAPTAQQFNTASRKLGLGWTSTTVVKERGRWRNATKAYLGERAPETSAQRSLRRRRAGKARGHGTYLAGVRQWQDQVPPPASTTRHDYNGYAQEHDAATVAEHADVLPLVTADAITQALGVSWDDVLRCARGQARGAAGRARLLRPRPTSAARTPSTAAARRARCCQRVAHRLHLRLAPRPLRQRWSHAAHRRGVHPTRITLTERRLSGGPRSVPRVLSADQFRAAGAPADNHPSAVAELRCHGRSLPGPDHRPRSRNRFEPNRRTYQ